MKGRPTSAAERRFHDALCSLGCIACRKKGIHNTHVSVHHIDGRTKPWAHWMVLPLCGPHHQDDATTGAIAVHPWKAQFEQMFGRQRDLLRECLELLEARGEAVPEQAWRAALGQWERMAA
jgi:hypothetical protein